ncbi:MAG: ComF family protein [Patescibacteria group bacterium]
MSFINTILNIIFPVNCLSCNKSSKDLCTECIETFSDTEITEIEDKNWIFPMFSYRNIIVKKSISLLKYKGKKRLAKIFAELLYKKILEKLVILNSNLNSKEIEDFRNPILIPIPLSPGRRRERGFNQTELLCKEILKLDKINNLSSEKHVLTKPKNTEHQALITNKEKRLKNIIGTYSIKNAKKIKNRNIILIDDVSTTGATLSEAKKVLKLSGAKNIIAFTIAH